MYTKGKWEVRSGILNTKDIFITSGETDIAKIFWQLSSAEANAHLIASAPDMYEALKQYERMGIFEEYPTFLKGLRNIIAKAEG